jgi:hypothetical protein
LSVQRENPSPSSFQHTGNRVTNKVIRIGAAIALAVTAWAVVLYRYEDERQQWMSERPATCTQLNDQQRAQWEKIGLAMVEGVPIASRMRPVILDYYYGKGKLPATNADLGLLAPDQYRGKLLQSATVLSEGRVELVFDAQSGVDGGRVLFTPLIRSGTTHVEWSCETPDFPLIQCAVSECNYTPAAK